jgi:hypothetical protein
MTSGVEFLNWFASTDILCKNFHHGIRKFVMPHTLQMPAYSREPFGIARGEGARNASGNTFRGVTEFISPGTFNFVSETDFLTALKMWLVAFWVVRLRGLAGGGTF